MIAENYRRANALKSPCRFEAEGMGSNIEN